jgi:hypothetical protein
MGTLRRPRLGRLGPLALGALLAGLLLRAGEVRAAPEPCPPDAPWEALCNVEPELRPSYLWLERVAELTYFRERISGTVRDRRVTVEWDWEASDPNQLGAYELRTRRVLLPTHLRGGPDRVEAAIMAHELWHAYADLHGRHRPLTLHTCLEDEKEAFAVGVLFYAHVYARTGEPGRPMTAADDHLRQLMLEWEEGGGTDAVLAAMAQRHVVDKGYFFRCMLVEPPPS